MSLQRQAYRSAGLSGISGIFANGLEVLKYIVLARILDPSDFGLLAMAMVIITIFRIFADGGTSNAVLHFRNQTDRQLSTLFWVNILAGSVLYILILIIAPFISGFYGEPEVARLLRIGGIMLPIHAAGSLYEVLLRKTLSFKQITISETVSGIMGFALALVLALSGFGVYALIWSYIATASCMTVLYIIFGIRKWRPTFWFQPGEVRSHLAFGFYQMGERGLNIYATRIDQLIIGRFFGPEILGAYHLAYQIILYPLLRLSPLLNRVALPVFSSRQFDDAILRDGYIKLMRGLISLLAPLFLLAGLTAPWLVPFLFGRGWEFTIELIPLMVLIGLLRMLGNPSGNIILSKGKARLVFFWNLAVAVVNTTVFLIGALYSIFVLLGLYTVINFVYYITGQWLMVNRLIFLTWRRFLRSTAPLLIILTLPLGVSWLFRIAMSPYQTAFGDFGMLFSISAVFLICYLPLVWHTQSDLIREFLQALKSEETSAKNAR